MINYTHVFAEPDAGHIIDAVHPETGRGLYSAETLEQIRARHPAAELMTFDAWSTAKAARQDTPIVWAPTTAEQYHEMLEVLPPLDYRAGAFLVGEPSDHHATTGAPRFQAYRTIAGQYFASSRPITRAELRAALATQYAGA